MDRYQDLRKRSIRKSVRQMDTLLRMVLVMKKREIESEEKE
jgi:hypothetical protein